MPDIPGMLLVVDDEPVVAEFMKRVLCKMGFIVDVAIDGVTARALVDANYYEATIVDIRMPRMNGRQLYDYIKDSSPRLARHVVFTSGELVDGAMAGFLASENLFFLAKPFGTDDLKVALEKALNGCGST